MNDRLRCLFFHGDKPVAIQFKKEDSDNETCRLFAIYERMVLNDGSGVHRSEFKNIRRIGVRKMLSWPGW